MIERVMKIDPEAAVKLEYRKRPVGVIALATGPAARPGKNTESPNRKRSHRVAILLGIVNRTIVAPSLAQHKPADKCRSE